MRILRALILDNTPTPSLELGGLSMSWEIIFEDLLNSAFIKVLSVSLKEWINLGLAVHKLSYYYYRSAYQASLIYLYFLPLIATISKASLIFAYVDTSEQVIICLQQKITSFLLMVQATNNNLATHFWSCIIIDTFEDSWTWGIL
jgi:hypothetical protein